MAFVFLHERLPLWSVVCLASAMAGVALIVGAPSEGNALFGVIVTFASVLACALYTVLLRRMDLTDGSLPVVFLQQTSALVFAAGVLLVADARSLTSVDATSLQWGSAIASGAFYYGLGFVLYVAGLRRTSAARAGMSLTLIPVFGLLFSAWLLGERLSPVQLLGAVVVIGSMAVPAVREVNEASTTPEMVPTGG
jgi:drug/metabolite transporter (DMT)-like permease